MSFACSDLPLPENRVEAAYHLVGGIVESMQQHRVPMPAFSVVSLLLIFVASSTIMDPCGGVRVKQTHPCVEPDIRAAVASQLKAY